jgi:hypothetical protein
MSKFTLQPLYRPRYALEMGWMGLRIDLIILEKRKIFFPYGDLIVQAY